MLKLLKMNADPNLMIEEEGGSIVHLAIETTFNHSSKYSRMKRIDGLISIPPKNLNLPEKNVNKLNTSSFYENPFRNNVDPETELDQKYFPKLKQSNSVHVFYPGLKNKTFF